HNVGGRDQRMSEERSCCGFAFPELAPPLFSFNSPLGMCNSCNGLGTVVSMDLDKIIPDTSLTIREGAVIPWRSFFDENGNEKENWGMMRIKAMEEQWGVDLDTPWKKIPKRLRDHMMHGAKGKKGM